MKAIILSAGQGKRLLPLTERAPKCTVPVDKRPLIEWQIDGLAANGIDRIVVVTGFGAQHIERLLRRPGRGVQARTIYNPRFDTADNLVSCWLARTEMHEDFVLLNGDTLFEPDVLRQLLEAPRRPVTMAIDRKARYDADDMKVQLDGERLLRVGKDLPLDQVDGESIGMMLFRGDGPRRLRRALEQAMLHPEARNRWYLSVLDEMARTEQVWTHSIEGLGWAEVDYPMDLMRASIMVRSWRSEASPARSCDAPGFG
jgi:choline kinase